MGVQNQTNQIEKPQTEPIQTETKKIAFGLDCFLTQPHGLVRFAVFILQPNRNIRRTLIKHMLSRPIFIQTKLNDFFYKMTYFFSC